MANSDSPILMAPASPLALIGKQFCPSHDSTWIVEDCFNERSKEVHTISDVSKQLLFRIAVKNVSKRYKKTFLDANGNTICGSFRPNPSIHAVFVCSGDDFDESKHLFRMQWKLVENYVSINVCLPQSDDENPDFILEGLGTSPSFTFRKRDKTAIAKITVEYKRMESDSKTYHCMISRNVDTAFFFMVLCFLEDMMPSIAHPIKIHAIALKDMALTPPGSPLAPIGSQYCHTQESTWILEDTFDARSNEEHSIADVSGKLHLRLNVKNKSKHWRKTLMDSNGNNICCSFRPNILSEEVFVCPENSFDKSKYLFRMCHDHMSPYQHFFSINVYLPQSKNGSADFTIEFRNYLGATFRRPDNTIFAKVAYEATSLWWAKKNYHCTLSKNVDTAFFLMVLGYLEDIIVKHIPSPAQGTLHIAAALLGGFVFVGPM